MMSTSGENLLSADPAPPKPASRSSPGPQDNSSEESGGCSKPDTVYSPVPLQDPKSQIRLLRFVSGVGHTPLALETSVWSLDEAPPYVAISYAWGGHNTRTVVINGGNAQIRYNAYYALRQVQLHHRQIHIWMDTICINQSDDVEKSAQVAIMYQIFEGATHVVSSLGAHSGDTEWLFTVVRCFEPLLRRTRQAVMLEDAFGKASFPMREKSLRRRQREVYELASDLTKALDKALCPVYEEPLGRRIFAAIYDLDYYSYWSRLWVVQEVAAARTDVEIICGPHQVSAVAMGSLIGEANFLLTSRNRVYDGAADKLLEIVGRAHGERRSLETNLYHYSQFHCSDLRDRLFAIVGITDWQKTGCPRMIPDYTKSVWELALEVGSTSPLAVLRPLVHALEITSETEEVADLLEEQRSCVSIQTMQAIELDADWSSPTFAGRKCRGSICFRLRATSSSGLAADIDFRDRRVGLDFHLPSHLESFPRGISDSPSWIARPVSITNDSVAALVCPDARPDDILVSVEGFEGLLLIVRASKTNDLHDDVVGQGLFIEPFGGGIRDRGSCPPGPCSCSPGFLARQSVFVADVHVALTMEELIVLRAQEHSIRNVDENSYIATALKRMATSPTTRPRSALSFKNFSCRK